MWPDDESVINISIPASGLECGLFYSYEDGTDSEFRNVGNYNSDTGELPKKEQITFRTRRKLQNKNPVYSLFRVREISFDNSNFYDIILLVRTNERSH